MNKLIIAIGLIVPFSITCAASINIKVGEEAVALTLKSSDPEPGPAIQLALIHNSDEDATLVNGGVFITGNRGGLQGRMGVKAYVADLDNLDGYGLALGTDLAYPLGSGISLEGGLYLGPGSLSFGDIDRYQQWYVSASFEIFENAKLAAGIGSLEIEPELLNTIDVDDGLFLEMRLHF